VKIGSQPRFIIILKLSSGHKFQIAVLDFGVNRAATESFRRHEVRCLALDVPCLNFKIQHSNSKPAHVNLIKKGSSHHRHFFLHDLAPAVNL